MIKTLERIGEIVRGNENGRVEFHPLFRVYKEKKIKKPADTDYTYYDIDISTETGVMTLNGDNGHVPSLDAVRVLKYDVGGKTFPYIVGNYEYVNRGKNTENKLSLCLSNITKLKIQNELITNFGEVLNNNISVLNDIVNNIKLNDGVIIQFTINNKNFYEYPEILDEIDTIYIDNMCEVTKDGKLLLKNSLYGFYNANSDGLMQSPNFKFNESYKSLNLTLESLKNLIYGVKFHENNCKYLVGDFKFIYLPNFENLKYCHLTSIYGHEKISESSDNIQELKNSGVDDNFIDIIFSHGFNIQDDIKHLFKFNIVFKLQGGNTVNDVLSINNVNLTIIEDLNNKIKEIKRLLSNDRYTCNYNILWAFKDFFKFDGQKDSKGYNTFIVQWIIQFFQKNYINNPFLDNILIKKSEKIIRNNTINNEYSKLITNFKFLRYMEANGKNKDDMVLNSQSYQLGKELGLFCSTWQDDRSNLVSFINIFNGQISRNIKTLNDVNKHYINTLERLIRNNCKIYTSGFTQKYNEFNEKFNTISFIRGYFDAQYTYQKKDS